MRDGGLPGETLNPPLKGTIGLLALPRFIKNVMAWFNRATDPFYANLLEVMYPKTVVQERDLVARRDEFRAEWHERWTEENLDFVLTVPHPLPALENGTGERASLMSAGYTFLFNMVRPTFAHCVPCFKAAYGCTDASFGSWTTPPASSP